MYACVCGDQGAAFSDETVLSYPKGKEKLPTLYTK
jgi:hypothetical protein